MRRREFLKYGAGLTAMMAAERLGHSIGLFAPDRALAAGLTFNLVIREVTSELIDGTEVFALAFGDATRLPSVPGPVMRVTEGDDIVLSVYNATAAPHAFAVPGIPEASMPPIPPGERGDVRFVAPSAGSYLYLDPLEAPLNRLLGLHGAMIVVPRDGRTANGKPTPFSRATHTPSIAMLFDALGTARFPGHAFKPDDPERDKIWLFHQIDPRLNEMAAAGRPIDAGSIRSWFLPRYFTINGFSGYDAAHDPKTAPHGRIGDPTLIRSMNAGLATHAPHIHGNDVFELSGTRSDGAVELRDNVIARDTWSLPPLARKDMLLPFVKPHDIPPAAWPPREEPFPLRYPMHCHIEMSQTAAGGLYPQGAVTDWVIEGPLQS